MALYLDIQRDYIEERASRGGNLPMVILSTGQVSRQYIKAERRDWQDNRRNQGFQNGNIPNNRKHRLYGTICSCSLWQVKRSTPSWYIHPVALLYLMPFALKNWWACMIEYVSGIPTRESGVNSNASRQPIDIEDSFGQTQWSNYTGIDSKSWDIL